MKQKVIARAIIKQDDKILLLRRKGGRPAISGLYELPGGRIHRGQQPEDALAHALHIHLNVAPETVQLSDVMTFIDPDDRELQYLFVIYEATLRPVDKTIVLSSEYDKYVWKKMSSIQREELTNSTQQNIGLLSRPFATGEEPSLYTRYDDKNTSNIKAIIYSDGASRGNPGPSAAGFIIMSDSQDYIAEGGAYLGFTANNVAEYQAVYLGLEKAQELGIKTVDFRMDSQLVMNQLNEVHESRQNELTAIRHRIIELARQFEQVTFTHVKREYNTLADGVVNKILDQRQT